MTQMIRNTGQFLPLKIKYSFFKKDYDRIKKPTVKTIKGLHMSSQLYALYGIAWEESEIGWGIRPDGYSFHSSIATANAFVKAYLFSF